jgi:hypothetical protein
MTSCRGCGKPYEGDPDRCPSCRTQLKDAEAPKPAAYKPAWLGGTDLPPARPRKPGSSTEPTSTPPTGQLKSPRPEDSRLKPAVPPTPAAPPAARPNAASPAAASPAPTPVARPLIPASDVATSSSPAQTHAPRIDSSSIPPAGAHRLPPAHAYSSVPLDPPTRPRRRTRAVGALLAVSLLAVGGFLGKDLLLGSDSPVDLPAAEQTVAVGEPFGAPVSLDVAVPASVGAEKLSGSLFTVSCSPAQGSATGVAYVVALKGLPVREAGAFADATALTACLADRIAYLQDGTSSLRVEIAAYDPVNKVVRLQIPAPLPAQAVRLVEQAGPSLVGTISNGGRALLEESGVGSPTPGSPLIDPEGAALGLLTSDGGRVTLGSLCGSLLTC